MFADPAMLLISIVMRIVWGLVTLHISSKKGRSYGFLWGFIAGLLGVLIVVLQKDKS